MRRNKNRFAILILSCAFTLSAAIKPPFGGEVRVRLSEPATFAFSPSNYSNLIFYTLIYENFFYQLPGNQLESNIFSHYQYDGKSKTLTLDLEPNLSFSNGSPITGVHVRKSLDAFLSRNLLGARKLGRLIRKIRLNGDRLTIELSTHRPDALFLLAVPELILQGDRDTAFSGPFLPGNWEPGKSILLQANPFYPGGRSYLDKVRVVFSDPQNPDVFLSTPGKFDSKQFEEHDAGIFQNIYLSFPGEEVGRNTRIALYSLFHEYFRDRGYSELNALTSSEESPVTINIKRLPFRRVRSVLRSSRIQIYLQSSMKNEEEKLLEFLQKKNVTMQTLFVEDGQLRNFLNGTSIKYMILEKVFQRRMPLEEKVQRVVAELTFGRFNTQYLQLISELREVTDLHNEEMLMDQVARIIGRIVDDGFLMPLAQKRYSMYVNRRLRGFRMDVYGRPILQGVYLP